MRKSTRMGQNVTTRCIHSLMLLTILFTFDRSGDSRIFANAQCNIKYFMSFDDKDCSLLNKFDDHEAINQADGVCT